jgi:hypothetical protein
LTEDEYLTYVSREIETTKLGDFAASQGRSVDFPVIIEVENHI